MDSDRRETDGARREPSSTSGPVLRATRRGALVLETENARKMMRRLRKLRPQPDTDGSGDVGTAPAGG